MKKSTLCLIDKPQVYGLMRDNSMTLNPFNPWCCVVGQVLVNNLGIIPEHLAEGIAGLDARRDEGLDSGSNPCTPIPTPFSPSPAQHSVLAEQLAAGITRLKVKFKGTDSRLFIFMA